jgi:hypothetical protein
MMQQHSCSLCWFTCNLISKPELSIVAARGFIHHCVRYRTTATINVTSYSGTHMPQVVKVRTMQRWRAFITTLIGKGQLTHVHFVRPQFTIHPCPFIRHNHKFPRRASACYRTPLLVWHNLTRHVIFFRKIALICCGHKQKLEAFPSCTFCFLLTAEILL